MTERSFRSFLPQNYSIYKLVYNYLLSINFVLLYNCFHYNHIWAKVNWTELNPSPPDCGRLLWTVPYVSLWLQRRTRRSIPTTTTISETRRIRYKTRIIAVLLQKDSPACLVSFWFALVAEKFEKKMSEMKLLLSAF